MRTFQPAKAELFVFLINILFPRALDMNWSMFFGELLCLTQGIDGHAVVALLCCIIYLMVFKSIFSLMIVLILGTQV